MDPSEILRIVATLNTRLLRAERVSSKYEEELTAALFSLEQARNELEETIKIAELLYETNQRIGTMVDFLLEKQGLKLDRDPASLAAISSQLASQDHSDLSPSEESSNMKNAVNKEAHSLSTN
ncbi:hypothetical protein N7495_007661 [Penicillium taxi]|uniref:uncharacterized protein n=1 Tax=Penicillium taxi TaxID=168475 RepID=UPI0025450C2F|nr:uncharacterized protein N7495_007661 [Penicillium taxi]KAJ5887620.1 hypothetical protein N7495_007661 [Penicillium taxi]